MTVCSQVKITILQRFPAKWYYFLRCQRYDSFDPVEKICFPGFIQYTRSCSAIRRHNAVSAVSPAGGIGQSRVRFQLIEACRHSRSDGPGHHGSSPSRQPPHCKHKILKSGLLYSFWLQLYNFLLHYGINTIIVQ